MEYRPDQGLIDLSVRQVLDAVSYSNILPPWFETIAIDYSTRRDRIAEKLRALASSSPTTGAYTIEVPSSRGERMKTWLVPSVNEQIVLHYLVLSIAKNLQGAIDPQIVFSYNLNKNNDSLSFIESQIVGWRSFQAATVARSKDTYMLQIDVQSAYQSIPRQEFIGLLQKLLGRQPETYLLAELINGLTGDTNGLPLLNDSLFYLGNIYLTVIDDIVRRHCNNYIRFVDDYRIFFASSSELDRCFSSISKEVNGIGFSLNQSKTRAGTIDDYIKLTTGKNINSLNRDSSYITPLIFADTLDPKTVVELLKTAVGNYPRYVTEGYGRLLATILRKIILTTKIQKTATYVVNLQDEFSAAFSQDKQLVAKVLALLQELSGQESQTWRVLWLLFIMNTANEPAAHALAQEIVGSSTLPLVVRLRAATLLGETRDPDLAETERLHDLSFLATGCALTGVGP